MVHLLLRASLLAALVVVDVCGLQHHYVTAMRSWHKWRTGCKCSGHALGERRRIKVACVGGSITKGTLSSPGHSYPDQLQILLGPEYEVRNFGVPGMGVLKANKFCFGDQESFVPAFYGYTREYKKALAFQPDVVVTQFASNDARQCNWATHSKEFVPDYEEMLQKFRVLPSRPTELVMLAPPYYQESTGRNPFRFSNASVVNVEIPAKLREVAQELGLPPPIDVYSAFQAQCPDFSVPCGWMSADGLHPNDEGYLQVARTIAERIKALPPRLASASATANTLNTSVTVR